MFYTIYQITHISSGKVYIGKHQTKDLDDGYMGSGKILAYAIEKYGINQFEKKILHIFDNEDEMNAKEAELVTEEFVKEDTNYNLCPGGQGGWGYVNTFVLTTEERMKYNPSAETRQKLSIAAIKTNRSRGKDFHSEESRKRMSEKAKLRVGSKNHMYGKTHSIDVIAKMQHAARGKKNSQFGTIWLTNGSENRKLHIEDEIPEGWRRGRTIIK